MWKLNTVRNQWKTPRSTIHCRWNTTETCAYSDTTWILFVFSDHQLLLSSAFWIQDRVSPPSALGFSFTEGLHSFASRINLNRLLPCILFLAWCDSFNMPWRAPSNHHFGRFFGFGSNLDRCAASRPCMSSTVAAFLVSDGVRGWWKTPDLFSSFTFF